MQKLRYMGVYAVAAVALLCCLASGGQAETIAYYSFDSATNPGHDDSGNGHDLTMSGPWTSVIGMSGNALHTETSTSVASNASTSGMDYPTTAGFSVEYWFKMGSSSDQIAVRDYWAGVACGETFGLRFDPTTSQADFFVRYAFSDPIIVASQVTAETGDWVHLLGVYNASDLSIKLFVDDVLSDQDMLPSAMRSQIAPYLYVQGSWHGTSNGSIDEVKLYNHAVPEPATMGLLALGGVMLRRRKR